LFVGPVFTREAVTAPRRLKFYVSRGAYVASLLLLLSTAWMILTGTQTVRNLGDLARFGSAVFQLLAPLQLTVLVFFAALSAASAVSQEKDRRTLVLLLLTNLTNSELVLGKLLASIVNILTMLAAALPLFALLILFGGVSVDQIARTFAVTLFSLLAAASLGSTLALWREKTFQTLAMTALVLVFWLVLAEVVRTGLLGESWLGIPTAAWGTGMSPWQAVFQASRPFAAPDPALGAIGTPVNLFLILAATITVLLNAVAIGLVRVWNPSRETRQAIEEAAPESIWGLEGELAPSTLPASALSAGAVAAPRAQPQDYRGTAKELVAAGTGYRQRTIGELAAEATLRRGPQARRSAARGEEVKSRQVWDNPILWREIRTWAYGRKVLMIRLAYLLLFAVAAGFVYSALQAPAGVSRAAVAIPLVLLAVVSLILVNAQAVTALTSERDVKALDLLLVTDLTPKEFIYGKLGGIFYNTKEMVLLPILLCGYLWSSGNISLENLFYLIGGLVVLNVFVAMLGVHAGMSYANSRSAIGTSLGTVFFLFIGVYTCIYMMISFSGSFQFQLLPFAAMMLGGGVGLFVALGARNPSAAIGVAALICPFFTFYAITSSMIEPPQTLGVFLTVAFTYGFTTAAMLVPAIYEFDVATGRTTGGEEG
jgi:hypothetical protein